MMIKKRPSYRSLVRVCGILACFGLTLPAVADDSKWQVGLATVDITPREPILLSGYGGRDKPFERIDIPLHAKCMAIEDGRGGLGVIVALDAECMYPDTAAPLMDRIERETGLRRDQVLINFSHSHAAPFLNLNPETTAYGSTPETAKKTVAHTRWLFGQIIQVIRTAVAGRRPARLYFGVGMAPFVMNRREFTAAGVRIGVDPSGYVDRSVPLLRVDDLDGKSRAVLFGCACHNTTLGGKSFVVSGDYAGYAQQYVEAKHPGLQAMFMIGCGADANPYPRGTLELARTHGETLARVVDACLEWSPDSGLVDRRTGAVVMKPVSGPLATEYERVDLPLRQVSGAEAMKAEAQSNDTWRAYHARKMLNLIQQGREVPTRFNCPLALWQFGDDLTLVAFSGEVVAGYVPLVEKAIGPLGLWISAYCNVMYGYVPTVQVIEEGGYETRGLEIGVGQFTSDTEAILLDHVRKLAASARHEAGDTKQAPGRPNILMILSDDLGYADLGHDGSQIDTPSLDKLRSEGMKFTRFYTGAPICSPSRAALLTGRYPHAVGVPELCSPTQRGDVPVLHLSLDATTIPELLGEHGYTSMLAGKWHLGYTEESWPRRHGFDEFWGSLAGTPKYYEPVYTYHNEEEITVDGYYTDRITDKAVEFINKQSLGKPFFLYLAYNAPHYPLEAPQELVDKYNQVFDDEKFAVYAAMVERMDTGIGRVLETLDEKHFTANTLVVFTSDNGPSPEPPAYGLSGARRSAGPLKGHKFSVHEGGIRVPFLARWPGVIPAGSTCHQMAAIIDLMPTFLEAAGIAPRRVSELDGVSMLTLLKGDTTPVHDTLHWETRLNYGIVHGNWKLVRERWVKHPYLYDLGNDMGEQQDLAERNPAKVADLVELHAAWRNRYFPVQYPAPTRRPKWQFPTE